MKKQAKPILTHRWLAWAIGIIVPILFFVVLELSLRVFEYGDDLSLFIGHPDFPEYQLINPNVGKRYYVSGQFKPEVSKDAFLINKQEGSLRLFVLGGSSAAGYPYLHNGAFSRILRSMLQAKYPHKKIEVINVAMTAVNSFTLVDLLAEILQANPDGILVYAGHNEFYGALGVGSAQSIGSNRFLINGFLKLIHFRTVQLIRNIVSGIVSSSRPSGTLMKRMVARQTIPLNGDLYNEAKNQFLQNFKILSSMADDANVPIAFANLVSNTRDQPPFISVYPDDEGITAGLKANLSALKKDVEDSKLSEAEAIVKEISDKAKMVAQFQYLNAQLKEKLGDFADADKLYLRAKDLDGLRFRASEEFNTIIKKNCEEFGDTFVDVKRYFKEESPHGIIGNSLILEHLHPNLRGYYLIGRAFFDQCFEEKDFIPGLGKAENNFSLNMADHLHTTKIDSLLGAYRLKILLNDWPFLAQKKIVDFNPVTPIEKIAVALLKNKKTWEKAHFEAADYYLKYRKKDFAIKEFQALKSETGYNSSPYIFLARIYLESKKFDLAKNELLAALKLKLSRNEEFTTAKYLGTIFVQEGKLEEGIQYLESAFKINSADKQLLYNLVGAQIMAKNIKRAENLLYLFKEMTVSRQSIYYLSQLLEKQKENMERK